MYFKQATLAATLLLAASQSSAQVANGDFESWQSSTPDSWTTIDSGIYLDPVSSPVSNGNLAARVTVTTASQSATDLRQSVSLSANQTYVFSTSIYHTEGGMRARLYVNGYQGYSNPNLVNQWQQIQYSYTPSQAETIEVGLRFYDVAGFDGSEAVYVDNFQPTNSTPPNPGPGTCNDHDTTVTLTTDNYASETSWEIRDSGNQVVLSNGSLANNTSYSEQVCLLDGDYTFTITDSYGDGICCQYGSGSYTVEVDGQTLFSGGQFGSSEAHNFTLGGGNNGGNPDLGEYYASAAGLTGYALKTELHNIIKTHAAQGYGAIWGFYSSHEIDTYYDNDGSILDIYSENPNGGDAYAYTPVSDQCGTYNSEADCYNREHSFPRNWFGGAIEPMNSDIHHIFASDGFVNSKRGSFPYGEVGSASFVSNNGSKAGSGASGLGYAGDVFEPIDEFKGDIARAQLYMATRYQNLIANWENNSTSSDAVLNGTNTSVFEPWYLAMLKTWHQQDPVSQQEIDRNDAAHTYQGNRNPFVDHPEFVTMIWGN